MKKVQKIINRNVYRQLFLISVILCITLFSIISPINADMLKSNIRSNPMMKLAQTQEYDSMTKTATMKDISNNDIGSAQLIYNTYSCGDFTKCIAIIKVNGYQSSMDILSYLRFNDLKNDEDTELNYNIYINTGNGYREYDQNEVLMGDFYIKIVGEKSFNDVIDWIPTIYGQEVDSWAVWGSSYVYDNFNNPPNINYTLWKNWTYSDTGGGLSLYNEGGDVYDFADSGYVLGGNAYGQFNTTQLPNYLGIHNLTLRVYVGGFTAETSSQFYAFGNMILDHSGGVPVSSDDSIWSFIENRTNGFKFDVFNDGAYVNTITPTNNVIYIFSGAVNGGAVRRAVGTYIYPITYVYSNNTINIVLNSPTNAQQISVRNNVTFNVTTNLVVNNLKNISLYINNKLNETRLISGTSNITIFTKNMSGNLGLNSWYVYVCDDDTNCANSSINTFTAVSFEENSQTYDSMVTEGSISYFAMNVSIVGGLINSGYLVYDGVQYGISIAQYGNDYIFSKSLAIPNVNANVNKTFYWIVNMDSGVYNSTSHNQSVINLAIDNCTAQSLRIWNFTLLDEKTQTPIINLNSSVEVDFKLYPVGQNYSILNLSQTYTNASTGSICISAGALNSANYTLQAQIKYSADTYVPEYYNIQSYDLNINTAGITTTLYDLLSTQSTDFVINFKDSNFLPVGNAVIFIKRKYVGEGVYKTVEAPITDNYGNTIGHFDTNGVIYSILVVKDNVILASFDNIQVKCQDVLTGDCELNLIASPVSSIFEDYSHYGNVYANMIFDKTNRKVTVYFQTTDDSVANMVLKLYVLDNVGNQSICTSSLTSSSGNFECVVPDSFGNITFVAELYKDNVHLFDNIYTIAQDSKNVFGYDGIFMVVILLITLPLMLVPSLIGVIIAIIIGVIVAIALSIYNGGSIFGGASALIWLIVAGGIIIWRLFKLNNRGGGGI